MSPTRPHSLARATGAAVAALAALSLAGGPAFADDVPGHSLLEASLVGSMPAPASPTIAGIRPGGAPWVNGPSMVRVRPDGRISVSITGLVIPPPVGKGVNPIASVVATLVCDDTVRASTQPFALSAAGDGATSDRIPVRGRCTDPTLLSQPAAHRAVYIASAMGDDEDD
jgi:hypothetical protein